MIAKRRLNVETVRHVASGDVDRDAILATGVGHLVGLWLTGALTASLVALAMVSHYGMKTVTETLLPEAIANAFPDRLAGHPEPAMRPAAGSAAEVFALALASFDTPRAIAHGDPAAPEGSEPSATARLHASVLLADAADTSRPGAAIPQPVIDDLRRRLLLRQRDADRPATSDQPPAGDIAPGEKLRDRPIVLVKSGKANRTGHQPKRPVM